MAKRIFVGNLAFSATEAEVRSLFEKHGTVHSVSLIADRDTGKPRGFGFVEMDDAQAAAAIGALEGADLGGRPLHVSEAKDRRDRAGGDGDRPPRRMWQTGRLRPPDAALSESTSRFSR